MKMRIFLIAVLSIMLPQMAWGMGPSVKEIHEQRLLRQRAQENRSSALEALKEVQGQLGTIWNRYENIDDALNYYRFRKERLESYTPEIIQRLLLKEYQSYAPETIQRLLLKEYQDWEFVTTEVIDKIKDLEKLKKLQEREQEVLEALRKLSGLIEIDMPEKMKTVLWSIPDTHQRDSDILNILEQAAERERQAAESAQAATPAATPAPTPVPTPVPTPAPTPATPSFAQQHKKEIGAIVTAITVAIATYIGRRVYLNKKNRLVKKYKLGTLTPLQNAIWRATALASMYMPWFLRSLVKSKKGSLADFIGPDPRALAELYYGHMPSKQEVQLFIAQFFGGVQ